MVRYCITAISFVVVSVNAGATNTPPSKPSNTPVVAQRPLAAIVRPEYKIGKAVFSLNPRGTAELQTYAGGEKPGHTSMDGISLPIGAWQTNSSFSDPQGAIQSFRWRNNVSGKSETFRWEVQAIYLVSAPVSWAQKDLVAQGTPGNVTKTSDGWITFEIDFRPLMVAPKNRTKSFYVRVVPTGINASAPSASTTVDCVPIHPVTPAPVAPTSYRPTLEVVSYTPMKYPENYYGETSNEVPRKLHFLMTNDSFGTTFNTLAAVGFPLANETSFGALEFWDAGFHHPKALKDVRSGDCYTLNLDYVAPDKSPLEKFADAISTVVSSISSAVDFISETYSNIEGDLVSGVKAVLPPELDGLAGPLVGVVLTSCGIPPALPNASELEHQGIDYIAAEVAENSPIPVTPELVGSGLDAIGNQIKKTQEASAAKSDFGIPHPGFRSLPPVVMIRATYNPAIPKATGVTGGKPYDPPDKTGFGGTPVGNTNKVFNTPTSVTGDDNGKPISSAHPAHPNDGATGGVSGGPTTTYEFPLPPSLSTPTEMDVSIVGVPMNGQTTPWGVTVPPTVFFSTHLRIPPLGIGQSIVIPVVVLPTEPDFGSYFEYVYWDHTRVYYGKARVEFDTKPAEAWPRNGVPQKKLEAMPNAHPVSVKSPTQSGRL